MKWKESDEMSDREDKPKEEYFDEEQYSPWSTAKDPSKRSKLGATQVIYILLGLAIVTSVTALLMLLLNKNDDSANRQLLAMEDKVQLLEQRLDKFEAIDEKVTRIWEQAKSFEKFKDRFDRTEASMSLRMDHMTMSLETLQKQVSKTQRAPLKAATQATPETKPNGAATANIGYHTIAAGDTFYSISKRYNIGVDKLLEMNRMKKEDILQPGQKLIVRSGN
jgi:LysM repeat protein